jgi:predicted glutamine amidotransferase
MCRLLSVHGLHPFEIGRYLRKLAQVARHSREYQGDGWGCAWRTGEEWRTYRDVRPIWEDNLDQFGSARLLLAHARSAFRNEPPNVNHNMPFLAGAEAFVFNGELRGVRLQAEGRIGAEKLFHFLRRFPGGTRHETMARALAVVRKKCRYIRAMNFVLADQEALYIHTLFSENAAYFTLHKSEDAGQIRVCSEPFPGESGWNPISNDSLEVHPFCS